MAPGDDPFDLHPPVLGQDFDQFAREPGRYPFEKVSFHVGWPSVGKPLKEVSAMSKPRDTRKEQKKKPKMTAKEKRKAKREKERQAHSFTPGG